MEESNARNTFKLRKLSPRRTMLASAVVLCAVIISCATNVLGQGVSDEKVLRNQDIVSLTKAGLSDAAIISVIRSLKNEFDLTPEFLISLRSAGVSNTVIEAMLGVSKPSPPVVTAPQSPADIQIPTAYGYYVVEDGQLRGVEAVPVKAVVGLLLRFGGGGWAVDGVRGQPNFTLIDRQPTFIFYQQNMNVQAVRLSPVTFVASLRAYEFESASVGTRPEFFPGIYGRNYNDVVPVNLWRRERVVIPFDVTPVEGKTGMFNLRPKTPLKPNKYVSYLDGALQPTGTVISAGAINPYYFALFFEIAEDIKPSEVSTVCNEYDPCLQRGMAAFNAQQWDGALKYFEAAASLEPKRGEAWGGIGGVYFELGQYNLSWEMLDKALRLGAPLGARVCRERSFGSCEQGVFMLSNKEASFTNAKKKQVFAAPPSELESHAAERLSFSDAAYTRLKVDGKNYRLFLIPEAVQCQIGTAVVCTEPGFTQQKVFANYVHHAIEGLVSGTLARPEPPPQPARQPVVPGGSIGEFRHETLVISGSWVVAQTPQEVTHTHPGVDIAAECGKPVYALADGTVIDIVSEREKEYEWLGYTVIIKHAEPIGDTDTYSAYIHMNEPPVVRWDQPVVAGQTQIGVVGKTGVATGCHLHLEVRHFGSRFLEDPEWNQPWNIYGLGDQRDSPILSEKWENPELLGIPLI